MKLLIKFFFPHDSGTSDAKEERERERERERENLAGAMTVTHTSIS
jgi:hypothetical protein